MLEADASMLRTIKILLRKVKMKELVVLQKERVCADFFFLKKGKSALLRHQKHSPRTQVLKSICES